MLDTDTKRRIDSARDILVGKVPDPKSQVEQVTIALIYKFMDDMDREAESLGGKRKFFTGDFAKYGWSNLMGPGLGGHEMLALYSDGIQKMPENPGIPTLFRDIFKNAFLPYKDPETLRAFLKVIDEFEYDHSERLGDAFEYLLSILGSQGDAGQFRTPRHIIDFMVEIMNPTKDDVILDPACGTAGFLISAYKHILKNSTDAKGHSKLTPEDREKIAKNIRGYDISPDMVRLSLVNLYLHGFTDPHIYEYDTLTSEDRWNEFADVILANPPFFSPKKGGAIKPHKRFSIQAGKTEVLFVDYMAEHLKPNGRAAIIVPEGIIFQSGTAYKDLRKLLVDDYLVAVISLPAGVFNPYSGVKTSILVLDKNLANASDSIAFLQVENDGYSLGAQRRAIEKNDLPTVTKELLQFLEVSAGRVPKEKFAPVLAQVVPKTAIIGSGDCNLSGERYKEKLATSTDWPSIPLKQICVIESGSRQKGGAITSGVPSIGGEQIDEFGKIRWEKMKYVSREHFNGMRKGVLQPKDVLIVKDGATTGKSTFFEDKCEAAVNEHVFLLRSTETIEAYFLYQLVRSHHFQGKLKKYIKGIIGGISLEFSGIEIPLPPLEVQKEIVAEIEGYQKVIDGAKAVIDNYRPTFLVEKDWTQVELGSICGISSGGTPPKSEKSYWDGLIPWVSAKDMKADKLFGAAMHVSETAVRDSKTRIAPPGSLLILVRGMGLANGTPVCEVMTPCAFNQDIKAVLPDKSVIDTRFLALCLRNQKVRFREILETAAHGTLKISTDDLLKITVPLPDLKVQQEIVSEIDNEEASIRAATSILERMELKIQRALARVWGEAVFH